MRRLSLLDLTRALYRLLNLRAPAGLAANAEIPERGGERAQETGEEFGTIEQHQRETPRHLPSLHCQVAGRYPYQDREDRPDDRSGKESAQQIAAEQPKKAASQRSGDREDGQA